MRPSSYNLARSPELRGLYDSWANRTRDARWKMAGDMPERMGFLVNKFNGIDRIVEFGAFEGCSTAAWMACARESVLVVDPKMQPDFDGEAYARIGSELGIDFDFIIADDLKIPPVHCDLLFIDTTHEEEQTYQELMRHHAHVSRYIVLHDTNPVYTGVSDGVSRWLKDVPDTWVEIYNEDMPIKHVDHGFRNDCGMAIYQRVSP